MSTDAASGARTSELDEALRSERERVEAALVRGVEALGDVPKVAVVLAPEKHIRVGIEQPPQQGGAAAPESHDEERVDIGQGRAHVASIPGNRGGGCRPC